MGGILESKCVKREVVGPEMPRIAMDGNETYAIDRPDDERWELDIGQNGNGRNHLHEHGSY